MTTSKEQKTDMEAISQMEFLSWLFGLGIKLPRAMHCCSLFVCSCGPYCQA